MKSLYTGGLRTGFEIVLLALVILFPCVALGALADDIMTPGEVRTDLDLKTVCSTKWGLDKRFVTAKMKRLVFSNYGLSGYSDPQCIPDDKGRTCEIDHRIPRCAAGADTVKNLSPQSYGGEWNAHQKDKLEVLICKKVCSGELTLHEGQEIFKRDWRSAYKFYYEGETK
jgi:hypothetical protein